MLTRLLSNLFRSRPAQHPQQAVFEKAEALLNANLAQQAYDTLHPVLDRLNDHAEAQFVHGTALLEMSRASDALPSLNRAVAINPREPRFLYNLAMAHWYLGDTARTIELCKQAVAIADFRPAHVLLVNIHLNGDHYFTVLGRLHEYLKPATYIEVGVFRGESLKVVQPATLTLGVDPAPRLDAPPGPNQRIFAETSDDFFANHDVMAELGGRPVEMAFIDGMHHFEFALRDFINIERLATPGTVVLVHDCYPLDEATATRERNTTFWSGDVWRLMLALKKYRPDLLVNTIATPPTGLGLILNLDPQSRVLSDNLDAITAEFMTTEFSVLEDRKPEVLNLIANDWAVIQQLLDSRKRR